MKNKQIELLARKLLRKSLTTDKVDPKKVKEIIAGLNSVKPDNLLEIYQSYLDLIEMKIEEATAYVETPFAPDRSWATEIEKDIKAKFPQVAQIHFLVNPNLIAGLKVKIADMVYENSYQSRLNSLRRAN